MTSGEVSMMNYQSAVGGGTMSWWALKQQWNIRSVKHVHGNAFQDCSTMPFSLVIVSNISTTHTYKYVCVCVYIYIYMHVCMYTQNRRSSRGPKVCHSSYEPERAVPNQWMCVCVYVWVCVCVCAWRHHLREIIWYEKKKTYFTLAILHRLPWMKSLSVPNKNKSDKSLWKIWFLVLFYFRLFLFFSSFSLSRNWLIDPSPCWLNK